MGTLNAGYLLADESPAVGRVLIAPVIGAANTALDVWMVNAPVDLVLDAAGTLTVDLVPSDSPDWAADGDVPYQVTERIAGTQPRTYTVMLLGAGPWQLSELVPEPTAPNVAVVPVPGPTGPGVPNGGTTGQALVKLSDADQHTGWATGGGGGGIPDAPSDTTGYLRKDAAWARPTLSDVTDAGTAAALDVPTTGDAAAGEVVKGDDTRLSDARTPLAHNHDGAYDPAGTAAATVTAHEGTHADPAAITAADHATIDHTGLPGVGGGGVTLSDDPPAASGTAAPGVGTTASRDDHVHPMPSAGDVGAAPTTHSHPAAEVSDSTTVGRAVMTAADAATARAAIGAGTSSLADAPSDGTPYARQDGSWVASPVDYGRHVIVKAAGTDTWTYRGGVVTKRPANIPAHAAGALVEWRTPDDVNYTSGPPLLDGDGDPFALEDDEWVYHPDAAVVLT